jgi:CBS domain-containing protein
VVSVAPDASVPEAGAIMRSKSIKRLAVVEGEQLLGLVTQTDITRALVSLWPYKEVGEIMSAEVVTADASATVAEAAGLMSARNISCVVVMRQRDAVGIMTEKDVLKRVVALHRDAGTTLVAEVMSHPIVTLAPSHSIMCVSRMMDRMRIHRLVVMENKQVHGVVSQTDILDAVRAALEQIREAQLRRQSEVSQLTEATAQNLSSIENLVREALGIPALASEPATRTGTCEPAWCGSPTSVSHGHYPDTAANPMLTALQDLIAESRNNLARMSRILQMQVPAGGHLDGARRFAPIPPQPPEATRLTEARFEPCPAGTDPGRAES